MFVFLKLIFTIMKQFFVNNNSKSDIDRDVTIEDGEKLVEKKVMAINQHQHFCGF